MTEPEIHPLEMILQRIAESAPQPWYPSVFCQETGAARDKIDPYLDQLRLAGLAQLTDWVPGRGQGYLLTPQGNDLRQNPRLLQRWIDGDLMLRPPPEPVAPPPILGRPVRSEAMVHALSDMSPPRATWTLITINVAVFLAGLALVIQGHGDARRYLSGGDRETLLKIGALSGSSFYLHGEWWRLLTCCFVHIGIFHLAVNMYSLYVVGPLLERMWGTRRFVVLYLIAGLAGSCGMMIEGATVGVGAGASGAIWGILASMVSWLYLYRHVLPGPVRRHWVNQLVFVFVLNLIITFAVPGISKGAHFGGGIAGLLAAFPLDYFHYASGRQKWLAVLGIIAVPTVALALLAQSFNRHALVVQEQIDEPEKELRNFNSYLHDAEPALSFAKRLEAAVQPLIAQSADERDDKQVAQASAALESVRRQLDQSRQEFQNAGPYLLPKLQEFQAMTVEYLEKESELVQLLQNAVQSKETSEQQRTKLKNLEQEVQVLRTKWSEELFGKPPDQ